MSEVTKYQYFLDTMKLLMKLKNLVEETDYTNVVENVMVKGLVDKNVSEEDINYFKTFIINLNESSFYEECMALYLRFSKYEDDSPAPNIAHFLKLELMKKMI